MTHLLSRNFNCRDRRLGRALRFIFPTACLPVVVAGLFLCFRSPRAAGAAGYTELQRQAEELLAEKSYARALELYRQAARLAATPTQKQWCEFRIADAQWRNAAAARRTDRSQLEAARKTLEKMVRDVETPQQKDRTWAEAEESLGDFHRYGNARFRNDGTAWNYYSQALDWWAGSSELGLARKRYLDIVWKAAGIHAAYPIARRFAYSYGPESRIPLDVLQNAVAIAKTPDDQARAHYLLARALGRRGGNRLQKRVPEEFQAAIELGRRTAWYDDALFEYARWMESRGRFTVDKNGGVAWKPDYRKAVELYRRFLREFKQGETPYWREAKRRIEAVTGRQLSVSVARTFLPRSEIQYALNWRNVRTVRLSLHPVNLVRDARLDDGTGTSNWLQGINLESTETLRAWTFETGDTGDHVPGNRQIDYTAGPLPVGAYILRARAGDKDARALVLVTDAVLIVRTAPGKTVLWFADAMDGKPIRDAAVRLIARRRNGKRWMVRQWTGRTDADGLAAFEQPLDWNSAEYFAAADADGRQAFARSRFPWSSAGDAENWRIYAFTDRPAYRPEDTVKWKIVARVYDGKQYLTPAGRRLEYEVRGPRGRTVKKGKLALNDFGAGWTELRLDKKMALGAYRVQFWTEGRRRGIGGAMLFRLEEYKLPEFQVTVAVPEENGRKKTFRQGDVVEAEIRAEYYSGGAVTNADVEVLVRRKRFSWWWRPVRPYPWYYDDLYPQPWWMRRGGEVVKREKLKTDKDGKVLVRIPTAEDIGQDWEYTVEARVTDASRREVRGTASVRVTRQSYRVRLEPDHTLARPGQRVHVAVTARDANDNPVSVKGRIRIVRRIWHEVWIAPDGREVSGPELDAIRARSRIFPPPPPSDGKPWRCRTRAWTEEELLNQNVQTDKDGNADIAFTPKQTGACDITWSSRDDDGLPITAHAMVWVSTPESRTLEYKVGGIIIITDGNTFDVGRTLPVLLLSEQADRSALFTVSADRLLDYRVVRFKGTARLLDVPVTDDFTPNIFLGAAMPSNGYVHTDVKQIIVPPKKHFIDVQVEPDAKAYLPRGEARFTITTRSAFDGRPVPAEVAFSVADEAVWAIQSDLTGDPRKFFFGSKRGNRLGRAVSPTNFVRLVPGPDGQLVDERALAALEQRRAVQGLAAEKAARHKTEYAAMTRAGGMGGGGAEFPGLAAPGRGGMAMDAVAESARPNLRMMKAVAAPVMADMKRKAGGGPGPAVVVRSDFRATAFWQPDVQTGVDGRADVTLKLPESLTRWKAVARAATAGSAFGMGDAAVRTRLPLIVRLQMPRFAVVGDRITVSAVVNNNTNAPQQVRAALDVAGLVANGKYHNEKQPQTVPPNSEKRFDWTLQFAHAGKVELKVAAQSAEFADAMKKTLPVHEHGIEKLVVKAGKVRGADVTVHLQIPKQRRKESTTLDVQVTPSLAAALLDALPFLIDYPYGCTEQTMSRFLPAVVVAKTLRDLGIAPADIADRMFGGIEPKSADKTHPKDKHSLKELDAVVKAGLERLKNYQHGDGGWGWWKTGSSDAWMTAYVVWGLSLARRNGTEVPGGMIGRGADWLDKRLVEYEAAYNLQAWLLYALAESAKPLRANSAKASRFQAAAFRNLVEHRERLDAYGRALLTLAAHIFGYADETAMLLRNLENGVQRDDAPDTSIVLRTPQKSSPAVIPTAHWGRDRGWFHWYQGGIEATAFGLRALVALEPKHPLVEPVMNWLVKNRRGAQWNNTRDTAMAVLALTEYLKAGGELKKPVAYDITVNGRKLAAVDIAPGKLLTAPSRLRVPLDLIHDGDNTVRIRRTGGDAPLYFAVHARFFSLEGPIPPAGNEVFVRRSYYRIAGRPTLLKGWVYDRVPMKDGDRVNSGDRIDVVVTVEAKNDLEYMMFEDLKPAGLEAVNLRSGGRLYARQLRNDAIRRRVDLKPGNQDHPLDVGMRDTSEYTGRRQSVYRELRDRKVALFIDRLPQGYWEIRYTLRAEVPGYFHALPLIGQAMYVPEIRSNSAELRLTVQDRPERP